MNAPSPPASPTSETPPPVTLSYANLLAPALGPGRGADPTHLDPGGPLARAHEAALAVLRDREGAGELGFLALPDDAAGQKTVQEVADAFGQWFEDLVVVGIGGSSLGGKALAEALLGPSWNARSDESREHYPRLHFLENADPDALADLLVRLDPRSTLFNVVSKSGSTAETMAWFLVLEEVVEAAVGPDKVHGHFLFTTDPEEGVLRKLARERGIPALEVPPNVGGRFSVLSAVGLLPAAVTGISLPDLLEGARSMRDRCLSPELRRNPAGLLAALLHAAHRERGQSVHVLMPYADRLRNLSLWFQQLWAESLGKAPERGPTPLAALGAVDQHSLLQLFMEGPRDKVIVFVRVAERGRVVPIPRRHQAEPALAYLGGHDVGHLLESERRATAEALRRDGRPSALLELPRLDARSMGGLLMLFQVATVLAGAHYEVNPLDQPGVEEGKRLAYGLLGRAGATVPELAEEHAGGAHA